MTTLVTGASGFIGSHVAEALVAAGARVRVAVRATSDTRALAGLDVERVVGDLRDADRLAVLVDGVDAVVHAAGATRAPDRETFLRVNADATLRLAEAAAQAGVRRFVLLSSFAARGPDQAQAPGDAPVSWYGLSKLLAERHVAAVARASGMPAAVLRLGGVYGPRDTDLLPLFRSASRGFLPLPPAALRVQPLHVRDAVAATLAAARGDASGGPWAVAEDRAYGWAEMGEAIRRALGRRVVTLHLPPAVFLSAARASEAWAGLRKRAPRLDLRRAEDLAVFSYTADVGDAVRALGWAPAVALPDGLSDTVAWYRREGWLA